jgi:hypothetical protein
MALSTSLREVIPLMELLQQEMKEEGFGFKTQLLQFIAKYSKIIVVPSRLQLCTCIGQGPSTSTHSITTFIKVIPTEEQWADMLTKPFAAKLLHKFRKAVLGW